MVGKHSHHHMEQTGVWQRVKQEPRRGREPKVNPVKSEQGWMIVSLIHAESIYRKSDYRYLHCHTITSCAISLVSLVE